MSFNRQGETLHYNLYAHLNVTIILEWGVSGYVYEENKKLLTHTDIKDTFTQQFTQSKGIVNAPSRVTSP